MSAFRPGPFPPPWRRAPIRRHPCRRNRPSMVEDGNRRRPSVSKISSHPSQTSPAHSLVGEPALPERQSSIGDRLSISGSRPGSRAGGIGPQGPVSSARLRLLAPRIGRPNGSAGFSSPRADSQRSSAGYRAFGALLPKAASGQQRSPLGSSRMQSNPGAAEAPAGRDGIKAHRSMVRYQALRGGPHAAATRGTRPC